MKDITINQFLLECKNQYVYRKQCVKTQFCRDVWDIESQIGKIRICKLPEPKIILFPLISYANSNNLKENKLVFDLTNEEYLLLEQCFKNNISLTEKDIQYLKKLKAI